MVGGLICCKSQDICGIYLPQQAIGSSLQKEAEKARPRAVKGEASLAVRQPKVSRENSFGEVRTLHGIPGSTVIRATIGETA